MHLFIGTVIGTVHIIINSRCQHRVIQSRIKFDFLIRIITCDFYLRQLFIPVFLGSSQIFVEIIIRCFGCKITSSSLHAYT